jgi:hypothetical protein
MGKLLFKKHPYGQQLTIGSDGVLAQAIVTAHTKVATTHARLR